MPSHNPRNEIEREAIVALERLSRSRTGGKLTEAEYGGKCIQIFDALRSRGIEVTKDFGSFGVFTTPWAEYADRRRETA